MVNGLDMLRFDLQRPDLTAAQANALIENPKVVWAMRDAARWRYDPEGESLSIQQIADRQNCTRGPVLRRLKVWRSHALAMLEEGG